MPEPAPGGGSRTPLRVETVILGPDSDQYAGRGQGAMTIPGIAATARWVEAMGFDGLSTPEAGHDPFVPLAICAEHTERVRLGTNVAIAFPRSPLVTAQIAWDLQQLSGGRFQLGLGTQVKGHNERRYATPWTGAPGPRLRDYLLCMKAMFHAFETGEAPDHRGEHYQFSLMPPFFSPGPIDHPQIPLVIAAVNPYMARLAGELCDGLRLHPIATFRYTRQVVLPAILEGARKAGRARGEIELIGAPFLAIGKDEQAVERAKAALKQQIGFYASTRTYHRVLEFHGWLDTGARLHELSLAGRWTEMPDQISDEMLEEWAVIATYDQLAERVRGCAEGLFDTVLLDLPRELRDDGERVREIVAQLHAS
ncbi:MAG: TIGR03617 family F420-dependent LLM class oxidoreductase [Myxococcota bacterium]